MTTQATDLDIHLAAQDGADVAGLDTTPEPDAPAAAQAEPAVPAWAETRINNITRKYRDEERLRQLAETQVAELKARLGQTGLEGTVAGTGPAPAALSEDEIESRINARAAALAEQTRFNQQCDDIARKGGESFSDFADVMKNYGTYLGGIPNSIIEGALETDDPHITIYELGRNMAEATRIASLSPVRQAAAVARFANKIKPTAQAAAAAPQANALTAAVAAAAALPAPIQAKVGSGTNGTGRVGAVRLDDDKVSMADWIKTRNEATRRR